MVRVNVSKTAAPTSKTEALSLPNAFPNLLPQTLSQFLVAQNLNSKHNSTALIEFKVRMMMMLPLQSDN